MGPLLFLQNSVLINAAEDTNMIQGKDIRSGEQIFNHKDLNGKEYTIAVDRLRYKIKDLPRQEVAIEEPVARLLLQTAGIEQHRLNALVSISDKAFDELLPMIILWFKDEQWVLADGNHQYVAAFVRKRKVLNALVAQRQQWAPFIIKDYKPVDYFGFSNIPERQHG